MQTEIVKYFNKILGYTAYPDQENVLNAILKEDEILISAGRGCGKTLVVAAAVTYMAEELDEPTKILVVSAQDSWVLYYLRQIYQKNNDLNDGLVSRSNQFVIPATGYSNNKGSDVFVRGASERSLRGPHVDVLIIDECALVPNESILTAFSCLVGSANPKVILLSTPTEEKEHLFNIWLTEDEPEYKILTWSSEDLPWNAELSKRTAKKHFSQALYASDVLGRPPTDKEISDSRTKRTFAYYIDTLSKNKDKQCDLYDSTGELIFTR